MEHGSHKDPIPLSIKQLSCLRNSILEPGLKTRIAPTRLDMRRYGSTNHVRDRQVLYTCNHFECLCLLFGEADGHGFGLFHDVLFTTETACLSNAEILGIKVSNNGGINE